MKETLFEMPENPSPALAARRADNVAFASFKKKKQIYTERCKDADPEWSAWYGIKSPLDFCDDAFTPDGKKVEQWYQDECFGYGNTEKEAVEDLIETWPHLGHWR